MSENCELSAKEVRAFRDIVITETYHDIAHWVADRLSENTSPKGEAFQDKLQLSMRKAWRPISISLPE